MPAFASPPFDPAFTPPRRPRQRAAGLLAALAFVAGSVFASQPPLSVWAEAGYLDSGLGEIDHTFAEGDFGAPAVRASARAWDPYNETLQSWARARDFWPQECGGPLVPPCAAQSFFNVYGDLGTVRGYARAEHRVEQGQAQLGQSFFNAGGSMFDWITPGAGDSLVFKVRMESTHHVAQDDPDLEYGQTQFSYAITLRQAPQPGCGDEEGSCDDLIASFVYFVIGDTLGGILDGYYGEPGSSFQVTTATLGGTDTHRTGIFELVLPNPGTTFSMTVGARVGAACDVFDNGEEQGQGCLAWVDAHRSAYLEIVGDYSSGNGFAYLGLPPVPEPATHAMWLAGLSVMGLLLRRRRIG